MFAPPYYKESCIAQQKHFTKREFEKQALVPTPMHIPVQSCLGHEEDECGQGTLKSNNMKTVRFTLLLRVMYCSTEAFYKTRI